MRCSLAFAPSGNGPCFASFAESAESLAASDESPEALKPELRGITEQHEVCRCLPGTVESGPPRATRSSNRAASHDEGTQANFRSYLHEKKKVEKKLLPVLQELEKTQHEYDKLLLIVQSDAKALEATGKLLGGAMEKMSDAYRDSGCQGVTALCKSKSEAIPKCSTQYKWARDTYDRILKMAKPTCEAGAVTLADLQKNASMPLWFAAVAPALQATSSFYSIRSRRPASCTAGVPKASGHQRVVRPPLGHDFL
eukprot:TRINITY_DN5373_c0_g1_i1.p1 TRINITY_DN5373_c0_g1~~TRINITY_DN5373_c0_g1_i1.p1  ORF type:complete len:254 (-),score=47.18 TRINITY_DN5373_c0_g1_i1:96-857(-)